MTDQEFKKFHDEKFLELSPEIRNKAIEWIRDNFSDDIKKEIGQLYNANPIHWCSELHFFWGMQIRNKLRTDAGIPDDQLPSGNWDDYYVRIIEAGCGLIPIPR